MNKKLLSAAIGAALAAGPLLAQADVKVYGKVHVSIDSVDGKGSGTTTTTGIGTGGTSSATTSTTATSRRSTGIASNASRWGIKVSEKLGGGMTALAQLETEIDATGETASQNSRTRYVGLSGGFGTLIGGIIDTPFKMVSRDVELFPEYVGDNRNLMSTGGNGGAGWDLRPSNTLAYVSPNMGGFTVTAALVADSSSDTTVEDNRRKASSFGLKYASGPLYANLAYETHRFNNITDGGDPTETGTRLGASYNFGSFKLVALWQDLKNLGGKNVITGVTGSEVKRKAWGLGGAYTAGNNVFKVQYFKADKLSNTSTGASADNTGAKMWAIGWDHLFSKTVKAYVAYAKTDNESAATFTVNGGGHGDTITPTAGNDPAALSIGMIVDF